jgi:hypothetical protein
VACGRADTRGGKVSHIENTRKVRVIDAASAFGKREDGDRDIRARRDMRSDQKPEDVHTAELDALNTIIRALEDWDDETKDRILLSARIFFGLRGGK